MKYQLKIGGQDFTVDVMAVNAGAAQVAVNGKHYDVIIEGGGAMAPLITPATPRVAIEPPQKQDTARTAAEPVPHGTDGAVLAPIPGLIISVLVRVGDRVQAGQAVAVMEAMKMENELAAHFTGVVKDILVQKGSEVKTGDVILLIE